MAKDIVIDFLTKIAYDIESKANVDVSYSQQRDYFSSGKILGQPIYYVFKYFSNSLSRCNKCICD